MPFALINESGEVSRIVITDCCEWGGAWHTSLSRLTAAERKKFRIYDVVDLPGDEPDYGVADGHDVSIDHDDGIVTRTGLWKVTPLEEAKELEVERIKRQASIVLRESDWRMIRALEQAMVTVLPAEDKSLADEREAVRMASDTAEAAVYEAKDAAELKALPPVDLRPAESIKG
jgi:hypothetical protein